jgi:toxin YoeB
MAADRLAVCHPEFLEDLQHWVQHDRSAARLAANRFLELVSPILCEPFSGMGKPEPLRYFGLPEKGQTDCAAVDLGIFRR